MTIGNPLRPKYKGKWISPEEYFLFDYSNHVDFFKKLIDNYDLKNKNGISFGSGYGSKELLFSKIENNNMTSIEIDEKCVEEHKKHISKYNKDSLQTVYNINMFEYKNIPELNNKVFDFIYMCSLSNWMETNHVIPNFILDIVKEFTRDNNIYFIANIYGGNFPIARVIKNSFIEEYKTRLESIGYSLIDILINIKNITPCFIAKYNGDIIWK